MLSSGKIGAAFAGVFLIGALSGGLIAWGFTDRQLSTFMNNTNDPDSVIIDRMQKKYIHDYHLTPAEMARIEPLIEAQAHNVSQLRHQFALGFVTTFVDYRAKVAAQLDPEHRDAFVKATSKRDKELRAMLLIDSSATPSTNAPVQGQN